MRMRGWVVAALLWGGASGAAWASSDVDILLNKLVEKGVLTGTEAGQIRQEIADTKDARTKELAKEILPDNWQWKGDVRLRNEYRDQSGESRENFNRQRIRLRVGAEGKVNDELKAGFRLSTGSNATPGAPNQTLDDTFAKKVFLLDQAYMTYTPQLPGEFGRLSVTGGMFENPFWVASPMVFDPDLSWAGVAVKETYEFGGPAGATAFLSGGVFPVDSDANGGRIPAMYSTQGGVIVAPWAEAEDSPEYVKHLKLTGALGYHDMANVVDAGALIINTPTTAGGSNELDAAEDFNMLNPAYELATVVGGVPVSTYGDVVVNTAASGDRRGFNLGVKAGKATTPWDLKRGWEAGYFYQKLDTNAAFDGFTDSDFNGGGTNNKGNTGWLTLAVLKNTQFTTKVLAGRSIHPAPKNNTLTWQWDLLTKF